VIALLVASCLGLVASLSLAMSACGSGLPSPSVEGQVAAYEAELLACVAEAGTLAESTACRGGVRAKYGRSFYPVDGGAR
jgi:hypothetical protein